MYEFITDNYIIEFYLGLFVLVAIPIFGAIKNIIKRKSFNPYIFARTFCVYIGIYLFFKLCFDYELEIGLDEISLFDTMILSLSERYLMFIFKIIYSFVTKNYEKKKFKYYKKYMCELSSGSLDKMYHVENAYEMYNSNGTYNINREDKIKNL